MSRRINGLIAFLMMFFLMLLIVPVFASGTTPSKEAEATAISSSIATSDATANATSTATGGMATGGTGIGGVATVNSRALSISGSGMEIRDCLATHALLFGLWQGTHINALCEAAIMNANGQYLAAAEMKCSTRKFKKVYGKGQNCIDAVISAEPTEITPQTTEDDARIEALYARITDLEAKRVQDKANAEKVAKRANAMAVRAEQRAVSQYGITDEQRQELAEVFK